MATWGKKQIKINRFEPESTLYYEYNTTVDAYYFKSIINDDFGLGNERYENEYRFGQDEGDAMMEAFINHVLNYKCSGDVNLFVEKYIKGNRFNNG